MAFLQDLDAENFFQNDIVLKMFHDCEQKTTLVYSKFNGSIDFTVGRVKDNGRHYNVELSIKSTKVFFPKLSDFSARSRCREFFSK